MYIAHIETNGRPSIIDALKEGRGTYSGETLDEIRARYPDARLMDDDEYNRIHAAYWTSEPVEITEDEYVDALEALPPLQWRRGDYAETFKMSEFLSGSITGIYCRLGRRYFCFNADVKTPHDQIVAKCEAVKGA